MVKKVYTATMGVHVGTRKGSALTIQVLANALLHYTKTPLGCGVFVDA